MTIKSLNHWLTGKKNEQALDESSFGRIHDGDDDGGGWWLGQPTFSCTPSQTHGMEVKTSRIGW